MVTALIYLVVVAAVGAVLFVLASLVFGRGEELAPLAPRTTLTTLPETDVTGADVRALRFAQVVRGYRADEVDWALARLGAEIDGLRARLDAGAPGAGAAPVPQDREEDPDDGAGERVGAHAAHDPAPAAPRPSPTPHEETP